MKKITLYVNEKDLLDFDKRISGLEVTRSEMIRYCMESFSRLRSFGLVTGRILKKPDDTDNNFFIQVSIPYVTKGNLLVPNGSIIQVSKDEVLKYNLSLDDIVKLCEDTKPIA